MKKKLLFLLGGAFLGGLFSLNVSAQISWTDKTTLITNPSFETDDAIQDLKSCGWSADRATGWTISPTSSSNAQVGVGNSKSAIQGIGDTFSPSEGEKYFYTRNNWNASTDYSFSQVIPSDNLKAGLYKLTCKAATYSSNAAFNTLTLGLQEGTGTPVTHDGIVLNVWNTWGVIIYKRADDTNLTIEVRFKPGYDGSSKHYAVLLDDFHLEYISEDDAFTASSTNPIDFSDIINNAGIYNHSTKGNMPRGWTATKHTVGNGNYTEGEMGDTRLEGWNGGNLDIDYNQTITNLPAGTYTVTAAAQERAEVGRTYVYASSDGQEDATGLVNSATESDITTSELKVANGTMKIGIRSTANDWVTGDNFRISFLGFDVDAVRADYETAYSNATTARDAQENENIVGEEKTTFGSVITTYTTDATQSYSWYVGAKEALENATTTFESVRGTYDALVTEIAKAKALGITDATADGYAATSTTTAATALTNTQALKVAEYNYVTGTYAYGVELGTWTTTGYTSDNKGQHWDGTNESKYKEQENSWEDPKKGYAADSWTIKFEQSISLPAGNYVFKVAGRKASGNKTTMSLDVTKTSDNSDLGTVNDFPEGDTGLGINTSGATDFTIGEGHTYANGGAGRGWEWRYVKFTLNDPTEVKIAVNAEATASSQWISFCNYTLQTDNEANISLIAYNIALGSAQTTIADASYSNVTGVEKSALQDAIDADNTLNKTDKDVIDAAKAALESATATFKGAKASYDALAVANDYVTAAGTLEYADASKKPSTVSATSKSDAETKTASQTTALRLYYESNALAEGVTGAVNCTSKIVDADFSGVTISGTSAGAWTFDQTGGTVGVNTDEPFTDGVGNSSYSYFDYYNGSNNNQNVHQIISNLEPGRYLLTVTGRAHKNFAGNFELYVVGKGSEKIPAIGNAGGVFDRGWNDKSLVFEVNTTSDVTIGAKTSNSASQWWGVSRFRLVKIADIVPATMTITAAKYATFIAPFDVTIPADVEASTVTLDANGSTLVLTPVATTIPANTPVILEKDVTDIFTQTFYGVPTNTANEYTVGVLTGTYAEITAPAGSYILNKLDDGWVGFAKVADGNTTLKVGANRCYIKGGSSAPFLRLGGATNISNVESAEADASVYDLTGRRVDAPAKGIYIVNGKKVLVK